MNLSKSKFFLILCLGFILGIFLGQYLNYETMAVCAMVFIIVLTVGWQNKPAMVLGVTGLVILAGALRFKLDFAQNDIAQFYGQKAQVDGVVVSEPDIRSDKIYLTLGQVIINDQSVRSKLLLTVNRYPEYDYGQKLNFQSKIQEPKEYPDFSYKNYLSRFGIDAVAYMPNVSLAAGNFGNPVMRQVLEWKKTFVGRINEVLPDPQSSFLAGLLLGAKRQIPQTLTDQFNRTGTSHLVAISGFNITIIAWAMASMLTWLGMRKRLTFIVSICAIVFFVIMTGASASAIRAGIMAGLVLLALNVGRLSVAANALAFTAAVMLMFNPQVLAFDVGFQLSFAALLGIIYLSPVLEKYFRWIPEFLRPYFLATLSAQIFTLPILLYNFGTLSIVALLPNILVLPLMPITMLFGFLTGALGLIWLKLSLPFAWVTWLMLAYVLKVIDLFARIPFAQFSWHINFMVLVIYYFGLAGVVYLYNSRSLQNLQFQVKLEHINELKK